MLGIDFRSFIQEVKEKYPSNYIEIDKEISPLYETTAVVTKLEMQKRTPILHFKNVKDTEFPVVVNTCASRTMVAAALGIDKRELPQTYRAALRNLIEPKLVQEGPVHEVVHTDDQVDILKLPQMRYHNTDGASYISGGIVMAKDPDTGSYNCSYDRLMIKGSNRLGIYMTPGKHLSQIYEKAEQRNEPMELAIALGNHPAWCMGALFIGPYAIDERLVMGGLMGSPLEVVQAKTVDLQVPARAEIVIEGEVAPFEREEEGPYGEFTGYSAGQVRRPFIKVKAITHRQGAIFQDICGGPHRELLLMTTIPMEPSILDYLQKNVPAVQSVRCPAPFTLFVAIKKSRDGQAKQVLLTAFAADIQVKHCVVVDDDIDITNNQAVIQAIATRAQADRDLFIIKGVSHDELDPSRQEGKPISDKVGVDATAKPSLEIFAAKPRVPEEVMERINLEDYIGKGDGKSSQESEGVPSDITVTR
ncbi:UbiD family decarboxylase [Acidobacteria bacterium AH-259-D05]|nr:UbiD family decarboxylase [Acidobacteria bacterium AH-259-D05]